MARRYPLSRQSMALVGAESVQRWPGMSPVPGVQPVDGWELLTRDEQDGDGFWSAYYVARGPERDELLDVCRFRFSPSQARFAWLVRNGFPPRPAFGPWDDRDIEAAIAAERSAAA